MCNRCTLSVTEDKLLAAFSGGSERSSLQKFQGAKVPHLELSLPGDWSEWSWERKVQFPTKHNHEQNARKLGNYLQHGYHLEMRQK